MSPAIKYLKKAKQSKEEAIRWWWVSAPGFPAFPRLLFWICPSHKLLFLCLSMPKIFLFKTKQNTVFCCFMAGRTRNLMMLWLFRKLSSWLVLAHVVMDIVPAGLLQGGFQLMLQVLPMSCLTTPWAEPPAATWRSNKVVFLSPKGWAGLCHRPVVRAA